MASEDISILSAADSQLECGHIGDDLRESQRRIPVINLPHRWGRNGVLIQGSVPKPCQFCHWGGNHEHFFSDSWETRENWEASPSGCAYCQLRRAISAEVAHNEGKSMDDIDHYMSTTPGLISVYHDGVVSRDMQHFFVPSDFPESHMDQYNFPRRHIANGTSLSGGSWQWAQGHIEDCLRLHELCRPQKDSSFLPVRLINVTSDGTCLDVKLQSSVEIPPGSAYVALSYCWGGHKPECMTTSATLNNNISKISWDSLPATFQDAVAFTRGLGVNYLWVDSICIIQGDEEDWTHQSGKMFQFYSNAYVTVAALFGQDSTSGLRNTSIEGQSRLCAELCLGKEACPLYVRQGHYLDRISGDLIWDSRKRQKYPLLGRAWAYQERIVSPRTLFFTESEVIFQCLEKVECECGESEQLDERSRSILNKTEIAKVTRKRPSAAVPGDQNDEVRRRQFLREIQTKWRQVVVSEFSLLNVTMPSDRLPALGAVAEQFRQVRPGETYLAGHWSGSFLTDLCWMCASTRNRKPKKELDRPFSNFPTWSWASLQSDIFYGCGYDNDEITEVVEIVDVQCRYVEDNNFGVLVSSKLILRGKILKCLLNWDGREDVKHCHLSYFCGGCWEGFSGEFLIRMDHDHEGFECLPNRQEVYVSEIVRHKFHNHGALERFFIILRLVDYANQVYTRRGCLKIWASHIRSDAGWQDVLPEGHFERIFEDQSVMATFEFG